MPLPVCIYPQMGWECESMVLLLKYSEIRCGETAATNSSKNPNHRAKDDISESLSGTRYSKYL